MKNKKLYTTGAIFLAIIAVLVYTGGCFATKTVHNQLSEQHIKFPAKEQLEKENPQLAKYADKAVDNGDAAKAYSEYIKGHLAKIADGKTYSEVSADYQKDKTNTDLSQKRQTLFMGETLRGLLLNAWGWGLIGKIANTSAIILGIVSCGLLFCAATDGKTATSSKTTTSRSKTAKKGSSKK